MDDVQALIEKIRRNIVAEAEQKFADETFQRLRYSLHSGRLQDADTSVCLLMAGGESMEIYLKFRDNRVEKASYITDGGVSACLCGSCAADLAIGKTPRMLLEVTPSEVLRRVARSGDDVEKSALHAVKALHKATEKYWLTSTGQPSPDMQSRTPRFVAVGREYNHMQYSH